VARERVPAGVMKGVLLWLLGALPGVPKTPAKEEGVPAAGLGFVGNDPDIAAKAACCSGDITPSPEGAGSCATKWPLPLATVSAEGHAAVGRTIC